MTELHLFPFLFSSYRPLLPALFCQVLCEECESCNRSLVELSSAVQEFGEHNPLLCKQLGDAVAKLTEVQRQTAQQVQDRANRLKKVRCLIDSTLGLDFPGNMTNSHYWSRISRL